jgi:membrane associated rhomboid family serine protease
MIPIRDTVRGRNPPLAVYTLVGLNVLVFALELTLPHEELGKLFYLLGIVPARYSHPQWAAWVGFPVDDYSPFLTGMFFHVGIAKRSGTFLALKTNRYERPAKR